MNKAILLSIQPQHLYNILIGNKTLELRKSIPKDFKGWVYLYCTKAKPYLIKHPYHSYMLIDQKEFDNLNGKVVARFWFDEGHKLYYKLGNTLHDFFSGYAWNIEEQVPNAGSMACLTDDEIEKYANGKSVYGWKIKQLEVFDTPMALSECYKSNDGTDYLAFILEEVKDDKYMAKQYEEAIETYKLTKAPQSYQYVWVKENAHD